MLHSPGLGWNRSEARPLIGKSDIIALQSSVAMKKLIITLHLYVGLVAALFLISLSLSGAVIAFEAPLNRAFHPQLTNVVPSGQPLNWDALRARVEAGR